MCGRRGCSLNLSSLFELLSCDEIPSSVLKDIAAKIVYVLSQAWVETIVDI
jgi:hypothetical protein